jgi:benzoate membrane transport protein
MALASALLAGVLARFGMQAFAAAQTALPLVLLMLASYLVARRLLPRYAVVITLALACIFAAARGRCLVGGELFDWPCRCLRRRSSPSARISLALPLFVVTMASQNLPGVAVMRATGYDMPVSRSHHDDRASPRWCSRRLVPLR